MKSAILSLLAALVVSGTAHAQSLFPDLYRVTPDANMLQQSAAKLGSELTTAEQPQLASAANALANMMERYRQDAGRNANPYYLQRRFSNVSAAYKELERELDSRIPEPRPYVIRIAWQNVQKSYDKLYYDLYGYDTVDPYFGQHADFAGTPPMDYYQPLIGRRSYYYTTPLITNRVERTTTTIIPRVIPLRAAPAEPTPLVRPQPQPARPFDLDPSTKALDL